MFVEITKDDSPDVPLIIPEVEVRVIDKNLRMMEVKRSPGGTTISTIPQVDLWHSESFEQYQIFNANSEVALSDIVQGNPTGGNKITSIQLNDNVPEGQNNIWLKTKVNGPCLDSSKFFILDTTGPEFQEYTAKVEGVTPNPILIATPKVGEPILNPYLYDDNTCGNIVSTPAFFSNGKIVFESLNTSLGEGGKDIFIEANDTLGNRTNCQKLLTYDLVDQDLIDMSGPDVPALMGSGTTIFVSVAQLIVIL